MKHSLQGIITPMITPLLANGSLDEKGLEKVTQHLIDGGVSGIFVLGTTGEATSLSYDLRKEVIEKTCKIVAGRLPVLVAITDSAPEESIRLAEFSKSAGAAYVVAAPPYYYHLNQDELLEYYKMLADRSPLPLFIYNMPLQTKIMIEVQTVKTLALHPNIIGLKDSSGIGPYLNALISHFRNDPEFLVFVGPDEMMAQAVLMGGDGGVNSGSNMFPDLFVETYKAAKSGDLNKITGLQDKIMLISTVIYNQGNSAYRFLQGIKEVASLLGLCGNQTAAPLMPLKVVDKKAIENVIMQIKKR